jgi:ribosomal protein S18 acetylase RimI-like enzyme
MGKTYVWLGVWEHNTRAIRFYEAHGFSPAGSHDFFLGSDRQTDIIMRRSLPQAR